jgi:hypothetical protein
MLSLSATEINLTILVDDERLPTAMRALHSAFFGADGQAEAAAQTPLASEHAQ